MTIDQGKFEIDHDVWESTRRQQEKELQKAYQMGLLHGINAQSMAQVERDVLAFEDYGWNTNE